MNLDKAFFILGVLVTIGLTAFSAHHIFLSICCETGSCGIHPIILLMGIYFLYNWRKDIEKIFKG